jgi:hypothetical protein
MPRKRTLRHSAFRNNSAFAIFAAIRRASSRAARCALRVLRGPLIPRDFLIKFFNEREQSRRQFLGHISPIELSQFLANLISRLAPINPCVLFLRLLHI